MDGSNQGTSNARVPPLAGGLPLSLWGFLGSTGWGCGVRTGLFGFLLIMASGAALAESNHYLGLGSGGNGWIEVRWGRPRNLESWGWARLPWSMYDAARGETRVATGDLDGDGRDELLVGTGPYPTSGGWLAVLDDGLYEHRFLRWVRVPATAYNARNGETFPACGDVDGDGVAEMVIGLGAGGGSAVAVSRRDGTFRWVTLPGAPIGDGATHPACADLDGDGRDEIVVGLGRGGRARAAILDDETTSFRFLRWIETGGAYAEQVGASFPACGDMDRDGDAEVVMGRASFPSDGGWMARFASLRDGGGFLGWMRLPWTEYNARDGATRPAMGDVDGDREAEVLVGLGNGGGGRYAWFDNNAAFVRWGQVPTIRLPGNDGQTWPAVNRGRATAMFVAMHLQYNLSSGAPVPDADVDAIVQRCSVNRVRKIVVGVWTTRSLRRGVMWARREPGRADLANGDGSSAYLAAGRGFSLQRMIDAGRAARPPVEVYASLVSFGENTGVSPYQDAHSDFLRNSVVRHILDAYPGLAGVYLDYIRYTGRTDGIESGRAGYFPYAMSGTAGWAPTQTSAGAGSWSLRTGAIGNNQSSVVEFTIDVPAGGTFSFQRRVSSESGGDVLRFLIDGAERGRWSGGVAWGTTSYTVAAGRHTFRWVYAKDAGGVAGSDAAWIDAITVPAVDHARVTRLVTGIRQDVRARGRRLGAFMMGWAFTSDWRSYLPHIGQHWEDLSEGLDIMSPMLYAAYSSTYPTLDAIRATVRDRTRMAVGACAARRAPCRVETIVANWTDGRFTATPGTVFTSLAAAAEGGSDDFSVFRLEHMDRGSERGEWDALRTFLRGGAPPSR